jgi:hypothetical protein
MTIELVPLAVMRLKLGAPIIVPDTPRGTRVVVEAGDGTLEGDRLKGKQVGVAAADWLIIDAGGLGTIDVRAMFETQDGALVYITYNGRIDVSQGAGTSPAYNAPLFDTGDERYRWLAKIQAVGKGHTNGEWLEYELYEVR